MTPTGRLMALSPVAAVLLQLLVSISTSSPTKPIGSLTIRVPRASCRFDVPWRSPPRPHLPSLQESRGRLLYSGVREAVSDGLGHGMATTNADVSTALRLGVTYTHRVAKYGSLVGQSFNNELLSRNSTENDKKPTIAGLSDEAGRIEGFFGWGVGEVPREAVQDAACDFRDEDGSISKCKLCTEADLRRVKKARRRDNQPRLRIDHIVEIPISLSYKFPHRATRAVNDSLAAFLKKHNKPYTAFHMPHELCAKSPAYSKFFPSSRSFFFHKYWDAHACYPPRDPRVGLRVISSMRLYRESWATTLRIPGVPSRGRLPRLQEHELTVAIHARRGDFFHVGRPMVPTASFARVVRKVVAEIASHNKTFARMPIAVNIYSEGQPKKGHGGGVGHNIEYLTTDYQDADGKTLDVPALKRIFRDNKLDSLGNVFRNGLRVTLRVSENTVLCLHEMVASDIFVGSMSGMSLHLVGSLSRGAMQILPARMEEPNAWHGHIRFDSKTGKMSPSELGLVRTYWSEFSAANEDSARRAYETFLKSKRT